MNTTKWTTDDFRVFEIDGLDERMDALTSQIRPKFHQLGDYFSAYFSAKTGDEFYPHVAKHARRTVNPPKDSWVAFAPYKRGYKALPHFQIGLWGSHLFIVLAVIYEAPNKTEMAERLLQNTSLFETLNSSYSISGDHMAPTYHSLTDNEPSETLEKMLIRLRDVKKGEFLVGRFIPAEEAVQMDHQQFMSLAEDTFSTILPIYNVMTNK